MKKLVVLGLLLGCASAQSATVYRCEDAAGHLTFSTSGCASDSDSRLQRADNPRAGGARPTLMAKPKGAPRKEAPRAPTVVATRTDECGDLLSPSERRQAIIRGKVKVGMSRADVENALGPPQRISQLDALTRYHYEARQRKERSRLVTFDDQDCVRRR
ncbi:DUF4124 domain-containing protein [Pseudomonas oryzihabitans]|uniref:DUF4124 domain-containing protein n=1 Tax=Pseudomonas oryzihabitans TaxID=47885 RepID=UPI0014727E61|nr:DUF4124 domain-containing protein [Pseudomonas oryzihabitans]NMZ63041.1 DUF4124 domain-containing protein [Pseudomonas oryzihabitans]